MTKQKGGSGFPVGPGRWLGTASPCPAAGKSAGHRPVSERVQGTALAGAGRAAANLCRMGGAACPVFGRTGQYGRRRQAQGQAHQVVLRAVACKWVRGPWKGWQTRTPCEGARYRRQVAQRKSADVAVAPWTDACADNLRCCVMVWRCRPDGSCVRMRPAVRPVQLPVRPGRNTAGCSRLFAR